MMTGYAPRSQAASNKVGQRDKPMACITQCYRSPPIRVTVPLGVTPQLAFPSAPSCTLVYIVRRRGEPSRMQLPYPKTSLPSGHESQILQGRRAPRRVGYERSGFAFLLNAPALLALVLLAAYPIL
jgi:hypothetical protein